MTTLSKVALNDKITARGLLLALGFSAFTAVCAQVSIHLPWTPVPVTLQVFAVLLSGLVLGRKLGAISQVQYLAIGLAGAPVFSDFVGGPAALLRPSGGYLIGFILAAYATGFLWERAKKRSIAEAVTAGMAGTAFIYFAGAAWLSVYLSFFKGESVAWLPWIYGVAPFIGVDAVKATIAAMIVSKRK